MKRFLRIKGKNTVKICFRCLSSDHLVSQCRDPIKCTSCYCSGHKSTHCKRRYNMSSKTSSNDGSPRARSPETSAMLTAAASIIHDHFTIPPPTSPNAPPPSPGEGSSAHPRRSMAEAHVDNGDYDDARVFAYVYLEHAVHSPHLFIRQAMEQACDAPAFQLAASARGAGVMVFNTPKEREEVVARSPITHDGNTLTIERHEEADNRFYAFYRVYAEIAAVDFPLEHWDEERARGALGAIGNVCCLDPACFGGGDYTSMRAVVRLDHHQEIPDQLLVRNHNGPASIANVYAIRTWIDPGPEPEWGDYNFGPVPALHAAPYYHPVGNPPTQLPPAPQNLVATVLEWENDVADTPPLRPVRTRRATPYPARAAPPVLALPWYGIGGVPEQETQEGGVSGGDKDGGKEAVMPEEEVVPEFEVAEDGDNTAEWLAALALDAPRGFTTGGRTDLQHESRAQKRRARRKRAKDSASKLRRSLRLMEKEEAGFELPEDKAARVQQSKFDFSGASRRLRNALSHSYLTFDNHYPSDDTESLLDIAAACGANEEEMAEISGGAAMPSTSN